MPNWMTVTIVAETKDESTFDMQRDFTSFNDVKPMPSILKRTTSGTVSSFVEDHYNKGLRWILENYTKSPHMSSALAYARCYCAKQTTGYFSWYEWSCDNWGVKWDICESRCDYEPSENRITFDVPWAFPKAAIEALSAKYPDVSFSGEFAEEQAGYFSGKFEACDGDLLVDYDYEFSDEAYERYFALCGGEEFYQYVDGEYVYIDD